jgi:hypothetical protein
MSAAGYEELNDFADGISDDDDPGISGLSRHFARLKATWFGRDFSTSDPVDADTFVERTKQRYRLIHLPECVLDSEELLRVKQEDIEHTSLTVRQLRLTGQNNSISDRARSILRKFRAVSIKIAFTDAELASIFMGVMMNFKELTLFTNNDVFRTIFMVCHAARNLRAVTVTSETPVMVGWFSSLKLLHKLELQAVTDDEPGSVWSNSPAKVLIIHDCRNAEYFQFFRGFRKLRTLELKNAPELKTQALIPALTTNLKCLVITRSNHINGNALLAILMRMNIRLTTFKLPLEPLWSELRSLNLESLIHYYWNCQITCNILDFQGHRQIHERLWRFPAHFFQNMKSLNVRQTGVGFDGLDVISEYIFRRRQSYRRRFTNLVNNQNYQFVDPVLVIEVSGAEDDDLVESLSERNVIRVIFHASDP